jgi:hypothetical protein
MLLCCTSFELVVLFLHFSASTPRAAHLLVSVHCCNALSACAGAQLRGVGQVQGPEAWSYGL